MPSINNPMQPTISTINRNTIEEDPNQIEPTVFGQPPAMIPQHNFKPGCKYGFQNTDDLPFYHGLKHI